uniref:Uncharacterized protein n=1 Tax=Arundo donax TaxID=35708 RepID=A0A0A8XU41_ARUDO
MLEASMGELGPEASSRSTAGSIDYI